jgi:hypothetical protein
MKINKQITLDEEIMRKLREEDNASALIERLLREYYTFSSDKKKNLMIQKQILLKNYSKVAKNLKKDLKIMKQIEDLNVDLFSIRWLRGQNIEPSPISIRSYINGRELKAKYENFIKAYKLIQQHGDLFEKI